MVNIPTAVLAPDLLSAEESLSLRPAKEHHNAPKGCRSASARAQRTCATQELTRSGQSNCFLGVPRGRDPSHAPAIPCDGVREGSERQLSITPLVLPDDNAAGTRAARRPAGDSAASRLPRAHRQQGNRRAGLAPTAARAQAQREGSQPNRAAPQAPVASK